MLTPNFTASQNSGTPSVITLTDSSTGSDVAITQRRAYLLQANGEYLVPTGTSTYYIQWAYANSSIDIDVLSVDTALSITVQWLNVSNTVLYTKTIAFNFTAYNETFYYGLTQDLVANPSLYAAKEWYYNKMLLRVYIDSADQAISFASDIFSAQECNSLATNMRIKEDYFF